MGVKMEISQTIKDKIKGLIFGQAIGDALGLGTEFLTKNEVHKYYPRGISDYKQIVQDKHRARWKKGDWTDDTDQFMCILNSIIKCRGIDLLDIAGHFHEWFKSGPLGIGTTTYKVLSMPQYEYYPQKAAKLVWKMKGKDIAPNGGIMRSSITGVWKYWDQQEVIKNSADVCELTHYDPRCKDSCKMLGYIISSELNRKKVTQPILQEFSSKLNNRINNYIQFPIPEDIDKLDLDHKESMGYTLKTLLAGLWAYYNAVSFEKGLQKVIEEGGDADTNGAVTGSLLGLKFGFHSIPGKWIEGLNSKKVLENIYEKFIALCTDWEDH